MCGWLQRPFSSERRSKGSILSSFQALEDEFAFQLEEQERHYGHYLTAALGADSADGRANMTPSKSSSSSSSRLKSGMDRKSSSKSSGSERSGGGSGSRKSSYDAGRRLSSSRHNLMKQSWFEGCHRERSPDCSSEDEVNSGSPDGRSLIMCQVFLYREKMGLLLKRKEKLRTLFIHLSFL